MNYKFADDNILWVRCQQNSDEKAYEELFNRYFPAALRVVRRFVNDEMSAEEIVMDCLFNLWAKRRQISIKGDFSSYLFGGVYKSVASYHRKALPAMVELEELKAAHSTDIRPDSNIICDDIREAYGYALEKLPPRRRQAFVFSRHENLSYPEIARKMNVTESAVKNYMTVALQELRLNMAGIFSGNLT